VGVRPQRERRVRISTKLNVLLVTNQDTLPDQFPNKKKATRSHRWGERVKSHELGASF
jgi:hypothetical protein